MTAHGELYVGVSAAHSVRVKHLHNACSAHVRVVRGRVVVVVEALGARDDLLGKGDRHNGHLVVLHRGRDEIRRREIVGGNGAVRRVRGDDVAADEVRHARAVPVVAHFSGDVFGGLAEALLRGVGKADRGGIFDARCRRFRVGAVVGVVDRVAGGSGERERLGGRIEARSQTETHLVEEAARDRVGAV